MLSSLHIDIRMPREHEPCFSVFLQLIGGGFFVKAHELFSLILFILRNAEIVVPHYICPRNFEGPARSEVPTT